MRRFALMVVALVMAGVLAGCLEKKPTALQEFDGKCRAQKFYFFIPDAMHGQFCGCLQSEILKQVSEPQFETLYKGRNNSPESRREVENLVSFSMNSCMRPVFGEFVNQMCVQAPNSPVQGMRVDETTKPKICACTVAKLDKDYSKFFGKLDGAQQMPEVMRSKTFKGAFMSAFLTCAVGAKLME